MRFTLVVWVVTRAAVALVFYLSAPHDPSGALGNWDGGWYGSIVSHGYEYRADGGRHNVAFFPLLPLLCAPLVRMGIAWPLAGALVNNVAFFLALFAIYAYARETFDERTAKWTVAVAGFAPLSLFGSVAYAEGLFMLFSTLALLCYRRGQYALAGVAAALASASRTFGAMLTFALVAAALGDRKKPSVVAACGIGFVGVAAFVMYCALRFHDPLAFIHAQMGWRDGMGLAAQGWLGLLRGALSGRVHDWITLLLIVFAFGTVAYRDHFDAEGMAYVTFALATIFLSGTPLSADRYLYTIVPILCTFGAVFRRLPPLGYAAVALCAVLLLIDAAAFAHFHWVA